MPPLWGKDSFNVGAGMARMFTAAAFVKHNMPLGQGGTLTAQEAVDVAAFFNPSAALQAWHAAETLLNQARAATEAV